MEEHLPGQGGPANTPPFPRRSEEPGSTTPRSSDPDHPDPDGPITGPRGLAPDDQQPGGSPPAPDDPSQSASSGTSAGADGDDEDLDWLDEEDDDLGRSEDEVDLDRAAIASDARNAASFAGRASARILLRAEAALGRGAAHVADRLTDTAGRLEQLADDQLYGTGSRARAGDAAHSAARWIDDLAAYLRDRDAQALREDVERQVRDRPVQAILLAVAVGWITGRIMR